MHSSRVPAFPTQSMSKQKPEHFKCTRKLFRPIFSFPLNSSSHIRVLRIFNYTIAPLHKMYKSMLFLSACKRPSRKAQTECSLQSRQLNYQGHLQWLKTLYACMHVWTCLCNEYSRAMVINVSLVIAGPPWYMVRSISWSASNKTSGYWRSARKE